VTSTKKKTNNFNSENVTVFEQLPYLEERPQLRAIQAQESSQN